MVHQMKLLSALSVALLWAASAHAQHQISQAKAKDHVGEKATVCGQVASTHYATRSRGNPHLHQPGQSLPESALHGVDLGQ